MGEKENDFLKRLLAAFKIESQEHLEAMSSGLLELEKEPEAKKQKSIIETVFREAHSLKGAARSVNMMDIEAVCRSFENIFSAWKRQEITPSPEQFDTLHRAIDTIRKLFSAPEEGRSAISELVQQLDRFAAGKIEKSPGTAPLQSDEGVPPPEESAEPPAPEAVRPEKKKSKKPEKRGKEKQKKDPVEPAPETPAPAPAVYPSTRDNSMMTERVKISAADLDALLRQTEEMSGVKMILGQRSADIRDISAMLDLWKKQWAKVSPETRMIRKILDKETGKPDQGQTNSQFARLLEFLDWNLAHIKSLDDKLTALEKSSVQDQRFLSSMVDNLLEDMKEVLMLPCSSLLEIFPKLVRDLSKDQGKKVEMVITGREVEIDRRIMEEIKDPLIHLVRNCIDHGIEKPEERDRKKISPHGTITIAISQVKSNQIEVIVSDNGAGIDPEKVKRAAVKCGIISEKDANQLNDKKALSLIFESGVSTSSFITDISGRGLGLAIVREKVEKLGGLISLETKPYIETSFRVLLPITLATFRGVLVLAGGQVFVVPTTNVERCVKVKKDEIKTVENKETISLNGRTISLLRLDDVLELRRKKGAGDDSELVSVLVLRTAEKLIAFRVDDILDEQEVLIKSLGKQLPRVRNITGATVLGSGRVVPILNVPDLMKSAVKVTAASVGAPAAPEEVEAKRKSILVVEDSITSRMLLKNILEMAGYHVKTAVDGVDAFTTLRTEDFSLVVSDVDMPRMNGFVLTSRIRNDKKLAELPVVLVTALESRDDRERGIDAGADAYIIKSSFEQSNLLEVIQRLI